MTLETLFYGLCVLSKTGIGIYDKANSYVEKLSDTFVLTDSNEPPEPQEELPLDDIPDETPIESDDLDELSYDDFDDDIVEFSDTDDFDDESLLGT